MANYLLLNQNQVFNGLGTLTYTVADSGQYSVRVQSTFPAWPTEGDGAGSGTGLGSGTGGGGQGFVLGDRGAGYGGVGQGFGATNNYQQPPSYGSNESTYSGVRSEVSIVVNVNGSPVYTASSPAVVQGALQFKTSFQASASDSVTVVISSSASADNQKNAVLSNVSISQGLM